MKQQDFKELCDACDNVLLEDDSVSRVAISWLHILKWDPGFLEKYNSLFLEINMRERARLFLLLLRYSGISLIRIIKGIWVRGFYVNKNLQKCESDFLFISHLINKELIDKKNDFYFGDIPDDLNSFGYSSSIAMINHIGIKNYLIPEAFNKEFPRKIVMLKSLSFFIEVKIYYFQILEALKLLIKRNKNNLHNRISKEAAIQALSNTTANNLRLKIQISDLVRHVKPRFIMLTYEGHAWERLIFSEVRKIDPTIRCIGYQHALIKQQHAIYRDLGHNYDPDIIATSGVIDLDNLENKSKNTKIIKVNIGSSKKFLRASSYNHKDKLETTTCLVLADGNLKESSRILSFASDLARLNPNVHFIFRLHPASDKKTLLKNNPALNKSKSNIIWSYSSLEEDFEMSNLALYRGTNAIFVAASYNVLPIFYGSERSTAIDPLSDIADIRISINETNQFFDILEAMDSTHYNELIKKILKYCNVKYSDLNIESLIRVL
mgnify:CR=1 FL=1